MQSVRRSFHIVMLTAMLFLALGTTMPAHAAGVITVTTTDGGVLGVADGFCSLREALQAAGSVSGSSSNGDCTGGVSGLNTIDFNIPISDSHYNSTTHVFTISIDSVSGGFVAYTPVVIDGTSQPGWSAAPVIEIRSDDSMSAASLQFSSAAAGNSAKGLMLTNSKWVAMRIDAATSGVTITNCYFSTDGISQVPVGHYPTGILLSGADAVIGGPNAGDRNIFSGNTGVQIEGASGAMIRGNYFGVQADGVTPITDQIVNFAAILAEVSGVAIPSHNTIQDNVIGGFANGIELTGQVNQTTIIGNKIGVAADGITARGMGEGILLEGANSNTIGGPTLADRNIISGNSDYQIYVTNSGSYHSDFNVIQGNYIGTNASGSAALVPLTVAGGIYIADGNGNQIGGVNPGEGNLIAGFPSNIGIYLISINVAGTTIYGNLIGTDASGANYIPVSTGIEVNSTSAAIGDSLTPGHNLISAGTYGIDLYGALSTGSVFGNRIGVNMAGSGMPAGATSNIGIRIANGAAPQVGGNWIANNGVDGILIDSTSTLAAGTNANNCFTGNSFYGVFSANTGATVPLAGNWWGAANGPSGAGGGSGDAVSAHVDFSNALTVAPAICSPIVSLDHALLDFGNQLNGTTSGTQSLTLTNTGGKVMTISSVLPDGPFSLGAGTCPASGTLGAGASCTILAKFSPTALGPAFGSVTVTTDAASSPNGADLSGTSVKGTQLLKNSSFEVDANADGKPDKFIFANFDAINDKRDCTVHKANACSLKLTGNGQVKTATQIRLKSGVAGDDFTFSLWSKAAGVPAGSVYRLQVSFFNGNKLVSTKAMKFAAGTHGFKKVGGTFTAAGVYTKIVYKITFKAAAGTAWFDAGTLNWAP